jgi:cation diffusion facilitator family transporter
MHQHVHAPANEKSKAAGFSVLSNSILVGIKLVVGISIGSVSVLSEAIHSGVDLLAALIAWVAVREADKPADKEHPFGHGKWENVSGTIEALLIFVAALWIAWEVIHKLLHPAPMERVGWGVIVMAVSSVANFLISSYLFRVAKKTDSIALEADAMHLRADVVTSLGVMAGLAVMWLGRIFFPQSDLRWVDPVAALGVAVLIFKAAWDLTRQAARDLVDASLPEDEEDWIRAQVLSLGDALRGYHQLRTRKSGSNRFIEVHLAINADLTVGESHGIGKLLTNHINDRYHNADVNIHIDPCDGSCKAKCLSGCLQAPERQRELHQAWLSRKP